MAKINIRGVMFDNVDMEEALSKAIHLINGNSASAVFTPNSEIVQLCVEDSDMCRIINSANLIIPDGAGVLLASKILKTPLKQKVAGVEFAKRLSEYCNESGKNLFLLGSKPQTTDQQGNFIASTADEAARKLKEQYPDINICGTADGYFKDNESDRIIKAINDSQADIVFVCLGCPRQEKWIYEFKDKTNAKLFVGLGGTLDVFAGRVKRAPDIFIKLNLEWFYRLIKEPRRLGRMMKIPKFLFYTILKGNKSER